MPSLLCLRALPSTIQRSNSLLVAVATLASIGCAGASAAPPSTATPSQAPSAELTGEAPPPHLRAAAGDHQGQPHVGASGSPIDPHASAEVTLEALLAYADRRSPVLSVARSTRSRAEAERLAARVLAPANPELSVALGARLRSPASGLDVELGLMQTLQIAGERGLRMTAADRLKALTDAEIEQLRWAVHCDVHAAFHRALVDQDRARLAERMVEFQREVLGIVQRQIAAGETAPLTLRLAQAEVAQAEQVLVGAEQALRASRLRLALLSGWPVQTPPRPSGTVDPPREPPPLERLVTVARQRLPSLRVGVARVREAQARRALADREAFPQPSVGVQYRREGGGAGEGPRDVLLGALSLPLPSWNTGQGARARARAEVMIASRELDAAERLLAGQIAEAHSEVVAAAARTRAYGDEILPRFEENLTLLRRSFELGEIDLLALSTGRERFLRIQSDALLAQQDYFVALASLERVVGVDLWHDHHELGGAP